MYNVVDKTILSLELPKQPRNFIFFGRMNTKMWHYVMLPRVKLVLPHCMHWITTMFMLVFIYIKPPFLCCTFGFSNFWS